jgi:hypothetical protein
MRKAEQFPGTAGSESGSHLQFRPLTPFLPPSSLPTLPPTSSLRQDVNNEQRINEQNESMNARAWVFRAP